jgi:membrane associated rhomboid family serine protease
MSWRERDYTWFPGSDGPYRDRTGTWREFVPPRATCGLLLGHLAGFIIVATMRSPEGAPPFALGGPDGVSWLGVLTHPIASPSAFTLLFLLTVIWSLGGRIESALGAPLMLALYLVGNVLGGLAFVAVAALRPELAAAPLVTPLGGMLAWTTVAWRRMPGETVTVFVKEFPLAKVAAFIAATGGVVVLLAAGLGAAAWIAAGAAGMAIPVVWDTVTGMQRSSRNRRATRRVVPVTARDTESDAEASESNDTIVDIDDILAKISREGMAALTEEERSKLELARKARLRREDTARVR